MQSTLTILGAGSSAGTPVVGCKCETCLSINPKNTRTRCSSLITLKNGKNILIDTSPDLREQSLRESITKVDAVLFTHAHADHCHGIDDLRAFCQINKTQIPLYGNQDVIDQLTNKFKYAMIEPKNFWEMPVLKPNVVTAPFQIFDEKITPIPIMHGNNNINGYRVGNLGYITDASKISENSMKLLEGVDVLLLDCLRMEPHFTHLSFLESIEIAKKIDARETYLIHMMHTLEYESLKKMLPEGVYVGYDGLKLQIN